MTQPIAISLGDPSGVGPELVIKAWQALKNDIPIYVIGDARYLSRLAKPLGIKVKAITNLMRVKEDCSSQICVWDIPFPVQPAPALPSAENAKTIATLIETAVSHVKNNVASAMVTAPINKAAIKANGSFKFPGHTEFLAHLTNADHAVMMLAAPGLRVVPTTIHIPLSEVSNTLTPKLLKCTITTTHNAMKQQFAIDNPRIAIAGLNPHAGENGTMGNEEQDWITNLVHELSDTGIAISGPHPADTMFHETARRKYDVAICMYHDQALIPLKMLDFKHGVNITLGLPIIRTSPDHGTAYDIAGKNKADPSSMIEAIKMAHEMAQKNGTNGN